MVADASTATVTMNVDGATWVHSAYALGIDEPGKPVSPERAALREFTAQLSDLAGTVGADQLGPVDAFVPENYLIQATEAATPVTTGDDGIVPTVVDWPATAGVALADAGRLRRCRRRRGRRPVHERRPAHVLRRRRRRSTR